MEVIKEELDRPWENLLPEVLALIFNKVSFQEILTVVPVVCKSWRKVAMQPECWQEIDIEDWCRNRNPECCQEIDIEDWCQNCDPENMDRMVKMLVTWSGGSMRKLSVCGLNNDSIFAFIAGCASSLQTLRIRASEVTDSIAIQLAPKFATLSYLDISYCEKMTSSSLEALGKHCQFLTRLDRNMFACGFAFIQAFPKDDEAFAIAKYMCRLKHLELGYGLLTNAGMEAILSGCKELQHLDVRGCSNVVMKDSLAEQCQKLKFLRTPLVDDNNFFKYYGRRLLEPQLTDHRRSIALDANFFDDDFFESLGKDLEQAWEMSPEKFDF